MSVICGILARNGAPIGPDLREAMIAKMPRYAADAVVQWHSGEIALARGLGVFTPEDVHDQGVIEICGGQVVYCGFATLNNRAELVADLGLDAADVGHRSDAWLVAQAYQRWQADCADRLSGTWAFAAWDHRTKRLTVIRDHSSLIALFYYYSDTHFAFSFRPKALLALPFVPKSVNLDRVGQTLIVLRDDPVNTVWDGIRLLPPAHRVVVDAASLHVVQYWGPDNAREVSLRRDEDYIDAFRDVLDRAVNGYLRSPAGVAATLSGGLDSALLAESAARQLTSAQGRLQAYTSVPRFNSAAFTRVQQFGDEGALAGAVARQVGGIDHHIFDAAEITPVAGIARVVDQSDTLDYAVGNCFWLCSMLDHAAAADCPALLMGAAGNASVSWDGGSYMANFSSWPPTRQAFANWHQRVGGSRLQALRSLVLAPLVPRQVRVWRDRKASSRYSSWHGYSSMNPAWFDDQQMEARIAASGRSLLFERPFLPDPREEQLMVLRPTRRQGLGAWSHMGAYNGVQARDPTTDRRLIEYCLGVPLRQYQRDGVTRYLARRALDGRVPDEVAWNRRRGLQASDLVLRIRHSAGEVRDTLERIETSDTARLMLDIPRMRDVLHRAQTELNPEIALTSELVLMRGIGAGLFLLGAEA